MEDKREKELKDVYLSLDEKRRKKMEKIAVGLLDVQMAAANEKLSVSKKPNKKNPIGG